MIIILGLHNLGKADEEAVSTVGKAVQIVFIGVDLLEIGFIILHQHIAATAEIILGNMAHGSYSLGCFHHSHSRRNVEIFAEGIQFGMIVRLHRSILHQNNGHLHQLIGERNQQNCSEQIKGRLKNSDGITVDFHGPEILAENMQRLHHAKNDHKHYGADHIERHMDNTGPLGIAGSTAQEAIEGSDDGGADINAHNDGICAGEIQCTGFRQRLQHRNGSGRRLDDDSNHQARKNSENRHIGQAGQNVFQREYLRKCIYCAGHIHQTHKQNAETDTDIAHGFGLFGLDKHNEYNADQQRDRRKRIGIKEPQ